MNLNQPKRYAIVRGLGIPAEKVQAYLPSNYKVEGVALDRPYKNDPSYTETVIVIGGRDHFGWPSIRRARSGRPIFASASLRFHCPGWIMPERPPTLCAKHTVASVVADLVNGLENGSVILREPEKTWHLAHPVLVSEGGSMVIMRVPTDEEALRALHWYADHYGKVARIEFMFAGVIFSASIAIFLFAVDATIAHSLSGLWLVLLYCGSAFIAIIAALVARSAFRDVAYYRRLHDAEFRFGVAVLHRDESPQEALKDVADLMGKWRHVTDAPETFHSTEARPKPP